MGHGMDLNKVIDAILSAANKAVGTAEESGKSIGQAMADGIVDGIESHKSDITDAILDSFDEKAIKKRIKDLQKSMLSAAKNIVKIQEKGSIGSEFFSDISRYYGVLKRNQKEIDGLTNSLKEHGIQVRNTTVEYQELKNILETIGTIPEKTIKKNTKQFENQLKLMKRIEKDGRKLSGAWVTTDGLFEIDQDKDGWKVHRKTAEGLYEVVGAYRTLNDVRRDAALIAEHEANVQKQLAAATAVTSEIAKAQRGTFDASKTVLNDAPIKKLTSAYNGLADAVVRYVNSSKKLWNAYDSGKDFSNFADERNAAIKEIIKHFPKSGSNISSTFLQDGYEMYLQSFEMSKSFANSGAEKTLESIESALSHVAQEMNAVKEMSSELNESLIETANIGDQNNILISSYEDLYNILSKIVGLSKQLKPGFTDEYEKMMKLSDGVGYVNNKEEAIAEIAAAYENVQKIKKSLKAGLSVYKHVGADGYEYEETASDEALTKVETNLRGHIINAVENFGYTLSEAVNDFPKKRMRYFVEDQIQECYDVIARNLEYSAGVDEFNAPIQEQIDAIVSSLSNMATSVENIGRVLDVTSTLVSRAESVNRYTLSKEANEIGSLIGIKTPHEEIRMNAKRISSYEELCRVVARYNELQERSVIYGGKEYPGFDEKTEMEWREIIEMLKLTAGNDVLINFRLSWDKDIEKLANMLGLKPYETENGQFAFIEGAKESVAVENALQEEIRETNSLLEGQVSIEEHLASAAKQATAQLRQQQDISKLVSSNIIDKAISGISPERFLSGYGIQGDDLTHGVDLFKDLVGASYLGDSSPKSVDEIFSELYEFVVENAQRIEIVNKVMGELRDFMNKTQIKIPDDMESSYAAEFTDVWKDLKKLYAIGGTKDKIKLLTNSKYASSPEALLESIIGNNLGHLLDSEMMKGYKGNEFDALRIILDAYQKIRAEFNSPKTKTIFGLDTGEANDFVVKLANAMGVVEQNIAAMRSPIESASVSGNNLAGSVERAAGAAGELAGAAGNVSGALGGAMDEATEKAAIFQGELDNIFNLISDAAKKTNFDPFKNVISGEDVNTGFQDVINNALSSSGYEYVGTRIKGDTGIVKLKDDIGNTIDAVFRLNDGVLQLDKNLSSFSNKPVDFKLDVAIKEAAADLRDLEASLGGQKYDGMSGLNDLFGNIVDKNSFDAFKEQLKISKKEVSALKKEMSNSTKSLNDVGRVSETMRHAETSIDTMRLQVERLGDTDGVEKLTADIERMAAASREFNQATNEHGQRNAYTAYNQAKADYDSDYKYAQEARKSAEAEAKSVAAEDQRIKQYYQEILNTVNRINELDIKIEGLKGKNESGLYTDLINQMQTEKEQLINQARSVAQQVGEEFSNGIIGKEVNLRGAEFFTAEDTANVNAFLSNARVQSALAQGDINQLQECLNKLSGSFTNSAKIGADAAVKIRSSLQEASKIGNNLFKFDEQNNIIGSNGFDESNQQYQEALKSYQMLQAAYSSLSNKPVTDWTAQESAAIQLLISRFMELGSQLDSVQQKQQSYFSGRTAWSSSGALVPLEQITNVANETTKAETQLRNFANTISQEMGAAGPIITNFTQSADGISRLDFSVLDQATLSIRKFRAETGTAMNGKIFTEELTTNKFATNIQSAVKQLESVSALMGRLGQSGADMNNSSIVKLRGVAQQLNAELVKGASADQNIITKLTRDAQLGTAEVEKLYRMMMNMEGSLFSGESMFMGQVSMDGNIYNQMVGNIAEFAKAQPEATVAVGKFDQATKSLGFTLTHSNGEIQNFRASVDTLSGTMTAQQISVAQTSSIWSQLGMELSGVGRMIKYAVVGYYSMSFQLIRWAREGVNSVIEIDTALTELKKVTDETAESYNNFLQQSSKTAASVGATVSSFTEATANFARLGYSMEESSKMAEAALVYKNVADGIDSVEASTDAIISTMKAFGVESEDVMGIVDRFNEVGNNFAITSSGIGEALQRSAAALAAAGNDIDESIALVTAANTVVQNPETVGTAFKTLSMRLRGAKVELEEAGEDVDGMAESTSELQRKLLALTGGKVDIMIDENTFKNTTQILREMAAVWDDMTDVNQAAALELMGGKRQANTLASVLRNFETVEEVISTSTNASGSALAENEKYLSSIQGHIDQFNNTLETMWMNALNSEVFSFFVDFGNAILKIVDNVGLLNTAITSFLTYKAFKSSSLLGGLFIGGGQYGGVTFNNNSFLGKGANKLFKNSQYATVNGIANNGSTVNNLSASQTSQGNSAANATTQNNAYSTSLTNIGNSANTATAGVNNLTNAQNMQTGNSTGGTGQNTAYSASAVGVGNSANNAAQGIINLSNAQNMQSNESFEGSTGNVLYSTTLDDVGASGTSASTGVGVLDTAVRAEGADANVSTTSNEVLSESERGVGIAATEASFGVRLLNSALMMGTSLLIGLAISGLIELFNELGKTAEKAEEAVNKYNDAQTTLNKQKKTINELSNSYERLSKGVNLDTNENINLTTSSYQEYLNICNDIADMYPHLVTGFDAQGNAILSLKGNVDELVQAYKEAAQLSRQEMIASGGNVFTTFKNEYDKLGTGFDETVGHKQKLALAKKMQELINSGTDKEINDFFKDFHGDGTAAIDGNIYTKATLDSVLKSMGIELDIAGRAPWTDFWTGSTDIDEFKSYSAKILSFIKSTTTEMNTSTSKVKSLMDAYLGEDLDYVKLGADARSVIDQVVSNLDIDFIDSFESADQLYSWIKTNIVDAFNDQEVVDAVDSLKKLMLEFNQGDITYSDYVKQLEEYMSKLKGKISEEAIIQIKFGIGIGETNITTDIERIFDMLERKSENDLDHKADYLYLINGLSVEDIQIAGQLEVPDSVFYTWDELLVKIKEAKIAATKDFTTDNFSDYAESISDISSTIGTYQEALEKLESGTFTLTDFMELIKEFPDLADGVDASTNSFNGLSQNLKKAIRNSPNKLVDELEELRDRLKEAGKSTTNIDQLITSIKNLPIDTVKSLSDEYVTLADQINKAKIAQNELQEAMSENPNEGYETRGEALDAMKKLMSEGKIGSESELWNIAEKYGFTYDSAQTINENADALARFIAAREEWYKTDDDGNYTFDGTKNFLNDVESVVANNARLQELGVKWEYDDSTGSLNFDFNNSDWDEVVKILGESKELAGLTSEEFYDLLMQVGQFFDINWQDANDLIYFMDQINNGTKSAAENFDTTKYAVTSFLESEGFSADALELKVDDEKFKALPEEVQEVLRKYNEIKARFEADPLGITWQLEQDAGANKNGGLTDSSIAAINQLVSTATDKETGVTWLSIDELSAAAKKADMDVNALMKHIKELQDAGKIIDLKITEEDPLGLQSMQSDAETTIKYVESLGIKMNELNGSFTIDVPSFVEIMSSAGWGSEQIQTYIAQLNANGYTFTYTTEENKVETLDVNTDAGKTKVDELLATSNELTDTETLTVNIDGTAEGVLAQMQSTLASLTSKPHNIVVNETTNKRTVYSVGFGKADGTAHAKGTAYKNGSWGAQKTETALVGELGPELLVRDGRWTTIGDNGAEFTQVRKGDIIFNHKQTEDLLSKGYITGRGRLRGSASFASGTAYPGGSGSFAGYDFSGNGGYKKFDVNGNLVDEFGNLTGSVSSTSDSLDDLVDSIDWIEIRMEEIDEALNKLSAELENTIGYAAKNNKINELIALNQQKYNNATAGSDYYNKYIDKYWSKIPKEYQEWAKNGAIAITDFTDEADEETIDAIQKYRDYVQKASDLTQQAEEVLTEISSLAKQAIDNIASDYENRHSLNDAKISQLEAYNDLLETDKGFAAEAIYGAIIKENESKIKSLADQRDAMQSELNKRVEAGEIKVNSQDWYDAINAIAEVDSEVINLKVEVEDLQDSINELHWDKFDLLMDKFQAVSDEAENLIDILDTKDVADELGNWTDEGITQLGLLSQQMEIAEMQAKQYEEEIAYLNENWENLGYTQSEYVEKLDELKSGQYDAIKAYNDTKDAIVDLNKERIDAIKEGIEKEIDAYEELIKKKKEELDAEKDLYDFQKGVANQQKEIADIERKLAALSGDNSASARAKRAKLEAELYEAQQELQDQYYDRSISDQQDALDKELENFQDQKDKEIEGWEKYLENIELVVSDSLAVVQANTDAVLKTITAMGQEFGLAISNALADPWNAGATAIQEYGTKLNVSLDVLAAMLGMTVDQFAAKLGMTTETLVGSLNITVAQMAEGLGLTNEQLAARLGLTVADLNGMMDMTIQQLAANMGVTLPVLAEKLGTTTAGLASNLDMTMAQFAGSVGLTVSELSNKFGFTAADLAKRLGMTYQDLVNPFGISMSATVDALKTLETEYSNILASITGDSQIAVNEVNKAMQKYQEAKKPETKKETTSNNPSPETPKSAITVGGKINAGNARIYATSQGTGGGNQYFASDPIYTVLKEVGDYVLVRHHKLSSGYTGWFKKSDIKAYAKGTIGTKKDALAWIDELGEELQLVPGQNGRLAYIQKGTGIVPADLTSNLMEWGKLDPQDMLDRNRPAIAPNGGIFNAEIKIDASVGTLVNIEHCDQNTLPDVEKIVNKAFDKHMQNLNNSIKRFAR